MSNFIKNVKQHKIAALISFLVLAVLVVILVLVFKKGSKQDDLTPTDSNAANSAKISEEGYFEKSDYPVNVVNSGNELKFELDGSKSPDSEWTVTTDDTESAVLKTSNDGDEKDSKLTVIGKPVSIGYAMLTFTRSGEINGLAYNAVTIEASVCVSENDDGDLQLSLVDISQSTANAGALDSKTPYLLDGDRIIFPAGGDWVLIPVNDENTPYGLLNVYEGVEADGMTYVTVERNVAAVADLDPEAAFKALESSRLKLISESLGVEQDLVFKLVNGKWTLLETQPREDETASEENADSSQSSTEESSAENE